MTKEEKLKMELEKIGIYGVKDLEEAIKKISLDISLMVVMDKPKEAIC